MLLLFSDYDLTALKSELQPCTLACTRLDACVHVLYCSVFYKEQEVQSAALASCVPKTLSHFYLKCDP